MKKVWGVSTLLIFGTLVGTVELYAAKEKSEAVASAATAADLKALETVRKQLADYFTEHEPIFETRRDVGAGDRSARSMKSMNPDGSWSDIDYADRSNSRWKPIQHLSRVRQLAAALYANPKRPDAKELHAAILRGLNYWVERDPTSNNWWNQSIGTPINICETVILLNNEIPDGLRPKLNAILARSKIGMTGQNRVWLSGIHLMKGLLENRPDMVHAGRDIIEKELVIVPSGKEGLQVDYSFHQHGPQLQFGNYGLSFFGDNVRWTSGLRNTEFSFPPEKQRLLIDYFTHGLAWALWKERMDFSACGRQIGTGAMRSKYGSAYGNAKRLSSLKEAKNILELPNGNRYFWCSDYMVQRDVDYFYSVKMCSTRTIGSESTNNENIQARLAADGVTIFQRTATEYENLMAVWDWRKLPGITAVQNKEKLGAGKSRNKSDFVGGLSDGKNGFCAMELSVNDLKAKKSFFTFGNLFVAMGSGIASDDKSPVFTSVNQCRFEESFAAGSMKSNAHPQTLKSGEYRLKNDLISHAGFDYLFPNDGEVVVTCGEVSGNWHDVIRAMKDERVTDQRFLLGIEHGEKPKDAGYFYIVRPTGAKAKLPEKLVTSSPDIHAVRNPADGAVSVVFFTAGKVTLPGGGVLESDQPVLLSVVKNDILCTDPTGSLKSVKLRINRRSFTHTFDPAKPRETQKVK